MKTAQDGVLEFLLINHPLDCPVCDRGGECPLQDQTLAFGPGESRFVEEKRHFEKPIPISDLVLLDRERCIQCGRCTRFAAEVAGDPLIDFGGRGGSTEVITYPDEPFSSYFSGNTVQICPVGALTASAVPLPGPPVGPRDASRRRASTCAVGCRGALETTSNRIVRLLGVDSEPVNQGWLCDKGRYGYEWVHSDDRVRARRWSAQGGELVEVSWPEALDAAADGLRARARRRRPGAIAVLGGARGTNEDAYVWARFAKGVLGTDNVDAQLGDGLPAEVVLGLPRRHDRRPRPRARRSSCSAPDLKEELPVLHLRVRRAAVDLGVPLVEIAPRDNGLTRVRDRGRCATLPGEPATSPRSSRRARRRRHRVGAADRRLSTRSTAATAIVVVLGRPSLAESGRRDGARRRRARRRCRDVQFLSALRRGNVHGALDLGLTPGFLPGRVTLDAGRDARRRRTGAACPTQPGLDAAGILAAAAGGHDRRRSCCSAADPLADFPDRTLAGARSTRSSS